MKKYIYILLIGISLISCKKAKIEKNLEGTWVVESMFEDGYNYISEITSITLEFSNVDKGSGNITLNGIEDGDLFVYTGTIVLNDDYSEMVVTVGTNSPDLDWVWDTNLTVDKEKLSLDGLSSDGEGALTHTFLLKAKKE